MSRHEKRYRSEEMAPSAASGLFIALVMVRQISALTAMVCVGDVVCNGGDSCCSVTSPCKEGEGDCDSNLHCEGDLLCGANNCDLNNPGFDTTDDCCFRPTAPDITTEPTETPISTISTTTTTATSSTNGLTLGKREIHFEQETSNK